MTDPAQSKISAVSTRCDKRAAWVFPWVFGLLIAVMAVAQKPGLPQVLHVIGAGGGAPIRPLSHGASLWGLGR
jgi:hypothetical protein